MQRQTICHPAGNTREGSALALALITLTVLSLIVVAVLASVMSSYRGTTHAASWKSALQLGESGADMAVAELRKSLTDPNGAWSGWTINEDGSRTYSPALLHQVGPGGIQSSTDIVADAPPGLVDSTGRQWWRVRSTGTVSLPGAAHLTDEKRDNRLRRLNFRWDPKSRTTVAQPQASRRIELIVKPVGFQNAITSEGLVSMNNHNIIVDSYDSRSESTSTNGQYDWSKHRQNGDVATDGQIIEAGNAQIYGDVLTNAGVVTGAQNVTGEQRTDFYQDLFSIQAPTWASMSASPATVTSTTSIAAGTKASPTRYKLDKISLSGNNTLSITPVASGVQSYVEVWVTGDIKTSGNGTINLAPEVHATIYVEGDMDITGNGFVNSSYRPLNLQLLGVQPPSDQSRSIKIAGNGAFIGAVYAPDHDTTLSGGGSNGTYWGSIVGKTVTMNGDANLHYDETLNDGFVTDYKITSWFEDNR